MPGRESEDADLDRRVRRFLYRSFVEEGRPPSAAEVAEALGLVQVEAESSLQRLHDAHVIVLAPGSTSVWMANPLSALPTAYPVRVGEREYFGNCIWDGLGVIGMLGGEGEVRTWCADCGEPMAVEVHGGRASNGGIVHYAVPARSWWDDIGFT